MYNPRVIFIIFMKPDRSIENLKLNAGEFRDILMGYLKINRKKRLSKISPILITLLLVSGIVDIDS